jgi:hypothetical protein
MQLGRSSSKLEEVKNQYVRSENKVRNAHNSYLLALCEVNLYQQQYSCIMLPSLLDLQQRLQENLVVIWYAYVFTPVDAIASIHTHDNLEQHHFLIAMYVSTARNFFHGMICLMSDSYIRSLNHEHLFMHRF